MRNISVSNAIRSVFCFAYFSAYCVFLTRIPHDVLRITTRGALRNDTQYAIRNTQYAMRVKAPIRNPQSTQTQYAMLAKAPNKPQYAIRKRNSLRNTQCGYAGQSANTQYAIRNTQYAIRNAQQKR